MRAPVPPLPRLPGNLPAEPNGFVGRQRDLGELARLIGRSRVLTLCGPGGIGKTRLAIRLAADLAPRFPDGAWLVDLAAVDDPGQVTAAVADALGVRGDPDRPLTAAVAQALGNRSALLLLDTCEHVVDAAAELALRLVASCPLLRVIATSREPLRVRGETAWRVPPLDPPPDLGETAVGWTAVAALRQCESVRLFTDRLAAARPGFTIDRSNAAAVAQVCRRLDGVPLALELAAACARSLSAGELAERLEVSFAVLALGDRTAPRRQQTLLATVEWSYGLLNEPERVLLRRLSVFRGWSLEMAERVCADHDLPARDVLGLLTGLIDKSLVIHDGELNGRARYRLLEAVRQYAAARAAEAGELPALRAAHAGQVLDLLEGLASQAFASGVPAWPERLLGYRRAVAELANCRAALRYLAERGDAATGLRICSTLTGVWVAQGRSATGAEWFDRFLAPDPQVPAAVRAAALASRGELAYYAQDYGLTVKFARSCLALGLPGPTGREAAAQRLLAMAALRTGRPEEALRLADEAGQAAAGVGDGWEEGHSLAVGAAALLRLGRLDEAESRYQRARDRLRGNHSWGIALVEVGMAQMVAQRGDHAAAISHFEAALARYLELGAGAEAANCRALIGRSEFARGDLEAARASQLASLVGQVAAGARLGVVRGVTMLGEIAAAGGELRGAVRLLGAAAAIGSQDAGTQSAGSQDAGSQDAGSQDAGSRGTGGDSGTGPRAARLLDRARQEFGPAAVDELLASGGRLGPEEAAQLAAALPLRPAAGLRLVTGGQSVPGDAASQARPARPARPEPAPAALTPAGPAIQLTVRELEVAELVASGLSNGEIGRQLDITKATAARHVANIFAKLGFRSRAQLAAWIADGAPVGPAGQPRLHMAMHSSADAI